MTVHLSFDEAVSILREAVTHKGEDYVYVDPDGHEAGRGDPACAYFDPKTGAPSCIVGHILPHKGITLDTLPDGLNQSGVISLAYGDKPVLRVDARTYALLNAVQREQDTGHAWGVALERALEEVADL